MDIHRIQRFLSTLEPLDDSFTGLSSGLIIHWLETVESTNLTLWQMVEQRAPEGTVAIARQQQSGRGQRGRQWQSLPGGLYLSLYLCPEMPAAEGGQLTLCLAWGVAAALQRQGAPVRLKWPNDLVVEGRKLGGILVETRVRQGQVVQAVVGIGINWENPVPEAGITLRELLGQQSEQQLEGLEELGAIALHGALSGYGLLQQQGIGAVLPRYESLLANRGQTVTTPSGTGIVQGVYADGSLRVRLEASAESLEVAFAPGTIQLGYDFCTPYWSFD